MLSPESNAVVAVCCTAPWNADPLKPTLQVTTAMERDWGQEATLRSDLLASLTRAAAILAGSKQAWRRDSPPEVPRLLAEGGAGALARYVGARPASARRIQGEMAALPLLAGTSVQSAEEEEDPEDAIKAAVLQGLPAELPGSIRGPAVREAYAALRADAWPVPGTAREEFVARVQETLHRVLTASPEVGCGRVGGLTVNPDVHEPV